MGRGVPVMRRLRRYPLGILLFVVALLAPRDAHAGLTLTPQPLVLQEQADGRFEGTVVLRNDGSEPVVIDGITAGRTRGGGSELPRGVGFEPGAGPHTIAPGGTLDVRVLWLASRSRARQLVGGLRIEQAAGRDQVVVALRAARGHGHQLPGLAVVLGCLAAGLAAWGRLRAAVVAQLAAAAGLAVLAVGFVPDFTAAEGHFGYQWVQRRALFAGIDWYTGLDGFSLPLALLAVSLPLAAAVQPALAAVRGPCFLLGAASVGVVVSLDVSMQVFFWLLTWGAAVALLAGVGATRTAAMVGIVGLLSGVATAYGLGTFRRFAPMGFASDGEALAQVANMPEWTYTARSWLQSGASVGELEAAWVATFVGFGAGLPLSGLHVVWTSEEREHGLAFGYVLGGLALGAAASLLRLWPMAPPLTRWAAPPVVGLGVVMALLGGIRHLNVSPRVDVSSALLSGGMFVAALGAMTPAGGLAAMVGASAHALGVVGRTAVPSRWLRAAAVGAPGTPAFWAGVLSVGAVAARHPGAGAGLAVGWALALAGAGRRAPHEQNRLAERNERGEQREGGGAPPEPRGGRRSRRRDRRRGVAVVAAAVFVGLGLMPAAWSSVMTPRALELHRRLDPAGPDQIAGAASSPEAARAGGG